MDSYPLFVLIQLLDLITTLWFTHFGAPEGNPVVLWLIKFAPSFTWGFILIKIFACWVGWVAIKTDRRWVIKWTNPWFAFIVVWNLFWILALRLW